MAEAMRQMLLMVIRFSGVAEGAVLSLVLGQAVDEYAADRAI